MWSDIQSLDELRSKAAASGTGFISVSIEDLNRVKDDVINNMRHRKIMEGIKALQEQVKIQCSDGIWNYDPYMHGMANGLICALATIEGNDPEYLNPPEHWLCFWPKAFATLGETLKSTQIDITKSDRFVQHIQRHLAPGEKVVCKIYNKTIDEIT